MNNLFLIGFMGVGKSTIASCLKNEYQMELVEMDEQIAGREGMSIPEIFSAYGEPYFREKETSLLREIQQGNNQVISCGGGVPMRDENVSIMKKNGYVVLLTAKPETILERVKDDENRPLLQGNKNVAFISELMNKRRDKYQQAADITVWTDGKNVQDICKEIINKVNSMGE